MKTKSILTSLALATLLPPFTASLHAQGTLTPPAGQPVASMKSLDQLEARTAIPKSPAVPVAGPHYTISQPGSYYLTGNSEVASGNGINITASNVTLDLNGFALINKNQPEGSTATAVSIATGVMSAEVKNGTIVGGCVRTDAAAGPPWLASFAQKGWEFGVQAEGARGIRISDLRVNQCSSSGISGMKESVLQNITVTDCAGNGIYADHSNIAYVTVSGCLDGVTTIGGSISHATVALCQGRGLAAARVSHSNVRECSQIGINSGTVTDCGVYNCGLQGIIVPSGIVSNCTVTDCHAQGISVSNGSVTNCQASGNYFEGILVNSGVVAHCMAQSDSTNPAVVNKNISVGAAGSSQRIGCVPASE